MIFIDPTEARVNTRLPEAIVKSSIQLQGLESFTGADLLLSPLSKPELTEVSDSRLSKIMFQKHVNAGILVQRKSGRDLTSSIPRFDEILKRMLDWTSRPWLLIIADLKCDREGQCVIDGQPSGFSWNAVIGALDSWQDRGGMLTLLYKDSLIVPWINNRLEKLRDLQVHPAKQIVRKIHQALGRPDWKDTLASFPGIGITRANLIAERQGTLAWAISWLSDLRSASENKIAGIGIETIKITHEYLGLRDGEVLIPYALEEKSK